MGHSETDCCEGAGQDPDVLLGVGTEDLGSQILDSTKNKGSKLNYVKNQIWNANTMVCKKSNREY